jgi:hypothetical protein
MKMGTAVITIQSLLRTDAGDLVPVESLTTGKRRWHSVEGAIELTVGRTPVITAAEWDDIGDLWQYLAGMVHALHGGESQAKTYFPDQPIVLQLTRKGGGMMEARCEIGATVRRAVAAETDLLRALCAAGILFYDHLTRLGAPSENYRVARESLATCLAELPAPPPNPWDE